MYDIILIFLLQLILVPILSLRIIFVVKNLSLLASIFGFMEALIYVFGLSIVFSGEQSIAEMLVYALGFGIGIFIGGFVEQKLAIGYTTLTVNLLHENSELVTKLRNDGFGVTVFEGMGRDSVRYQLQILTSRSLEEKVINMISLADPHAFIISYEPRKFKGGYLLKSMKKKAKGTVKVN
ncbi:DUF2179 domain-containing protein [Bacillus luteolus]|uniref:UPF0316 protein IMZ08_02525 n=1 Tax=Litchfieldia luteola TaxID=682179 RepID=A0ABR9QEL2_9BACI|nr:DUF5698 domain-containing protein [Cytobacillus luteolus]MBE4906933.1 DUF2179 domain-containing protein [Cytobacillus luteolus]MBP1943604.1 uncharacterized protein YebE (UPF0316 family) [Cytobacillus luteolus]